MATWVIPGGQQVIILNCLDFQMLLFSSHKTLRASKLQEGCQADVTYRCYQIFQCCNSDCVSQIFMNFWKRLKPLIICRASAVPNQIHSVAFRLNTMDWIWFGRAVARRMKWGLHSLF